MNAARIALVGFTLAALFAPLARADSETETAPQLTAGETSDSSQDPQDTSDKLTQSQAVPYFENGKPAGYRPAEAAPDSRLENGGTVDSSHGLQLINTGMITNRNINTELDNEESSAGDGLPPQE